MTTSSASTAGRPRPDGSRCAACSQQRELAQATRRGSATQQGYGAPWRKLRAEVLAAQPWCGECGAVATDVDHIVPRRRGGTDAFSNLRPLCHGCHSRKTVTQDGGFGMRVRG